MNSAMQNLPRSNSDTWTWWRHFFVCVIGMLAIAAVFVLGRWSGARHASAENMPPAIPVVSSAQTYKGLSTLKAGSTAAVPRNTLWDAKSALAGIMKKYAGSRRLLAIADLIDRTSISELAGLINQMQPVPRANFTIGLSTWH